MLTTWGLTCVWMHKQTHKQTEVSCRAWSALPYFSGSLTAGPSAAHKGTSSLVSVCVSRTPTCRDIKGVKSRCEWKTLTDAYNAVIKRLPTMKRFAGTRIHLHWPGLNAVTFQYRTLVLRYSVRFSCRQHQMFKSHVQCRERVFCLNLGTFRTLNYITS